MSQIITRPSESHATPADDAIMFGSLKDRLDFYRKEIQYETTMLSNRTNAYLGAQSFLVIAYSSSMGNTHPQWGNFFSLVVSILLAVLGLITSLHAWSGIKAASEIIGHWYLKQTHLLQSQPGMSDVYDDSPLFAKRESNQRGYRDALKFSIRSPWIFSTLWIVLGGFSGFIHFVGVKL
ncbi:hypothetical protein [Pseudomonas sp. NPDC088444]|uniref:RipA family octameric membrane protein n=1 Tax=Pseudomonas sp. NPDC088444 TaxID=3364456 RepID=UPI00384ED323